MDYAMKSYRRLAITNGARICSGAALCATMLLVAGCGGEITTITPPTAETAAQDPQVLFATEVAPVLAARCSGIYCHGVPEGTSHEALGESFFTFPTNSVGEIATEAQVASSYTQTKRHIDTTEDARFSTLLRKPLAPAVGGLPHEGGHPWRSTRDPGYVALARWIALEEGGGQGMAPTELTDLEERFRDEVLPVLVEQRCLTSNCHGPDAFLSSFRLEPPVEGVFASGQIRANANKTRRFINLDGEPLKSRLLAKTTPLSMGGIFHKGGNDFFFAGPADPDLQAIVDWTEAVRRQVMKAEPGVTGVAFISGPKAPAPIFDVTVPRWGTDLFILDGFPPKGPAVNVTAEHHSGRADVRDPSVSHDGRRIVFSMRPNEAEGQNLFEYNIAAGTITQLTFDPTVASTGVPIVNVQPVYGPDGHIYFTSTRSGELGDRGELPNTDIYELKPITGEIRRRTYGPNQELKPAFLKYAGFGGELAFTSTRQFGDLFSAPVFRFPPNLEAEYHVHFGSQREEVLYSITDSATGLQFVILTDKDSVWEGGALATIDRNFGPDIVDEARVGQAALPVFAHTLNNITPEVVYDGGVSPGGLYRDPSPLPDGRMLVSRASGPIDPRDEDAAVDYEIVVLSVGFDPVTKAPAVTGSEVIYDFPGGHDVSAVAIAPRAPEPYSHHHDDWDSPTGYINMFSLPLLQAIVETLEPRAKVLRDDLAFVRIMEALPPTPDEMNPVDPDATLHGDASANWLTGGSNDRVRILGTVPLGRDGSFYVEVPANRPLRFQALNADKMAVGSQHMRWIFANPGEVLFHATHEKVYRLRCAGCHGTLEGNPVDAFGVRPDIVSSASISDSTHTGSDPLAPTQPLLVGLDPASTRVIDFVDDLQPILDRSCATAQCHRGATPAGGLTLEGAPTTYYNTAYENLLIPGDGSGGSKSYVDEPGSRAISSFLMEKIYGRELEAPRALTEVCPPPGSNIPSMTLEEMELFSAWIDAGATYRGLEGDLR